MESILDSVKKSLGIAIDYTPFDPELIIHINSALSTLYQLGVNNENWHSITGKDDKWTDCFPDDPRLEFIKTYIYLKVKIVFDPPSSSSVLTSYTNQINELSWRILVANEEVQKGGDDK